MTSGNYGGDTSIPDSLNQTLVLMQVILGAAMYNAYALLWWGSSLLLPLRRAATLIPCVPYCGIHNDVCFLAFAGSPVTSPGL